jgi:hypothetical protein
MGRAFALIYYPPTILADQYSLNPDPDQAFRVNPDPDLLKVCDNLPLYVL